MWRKIHCDAVRLVLAQGRVGETYNIGGGGEKRNLEIVEAIAILDQSCPDDPVVPGQGAAAPVTTAAMPSMRARSKANLDGGRAKAFESGIRKTVQWYLQNEEWVKGVTSGNYRKWMATQYS